MSNSKALYLLLAALLLAVLTSRWMLDGPKAPIDVASFEALYFDLQWIAFVVTVGALWVLVTNWRSSRQFPRPVILAAVMLIYFVATGIPLTEKSSEWAQGSGGVASLLGTSQIHGIAQEIESRLAGAWKSGARIYTIRRDALTIETSAKPETLSPLTCGSEPAYFRFRYATEDIFYNNPAAEPYYKLLAKPPVPMFEAACRGRLYTFVLRPDDTLVVFHNLHERDPVIEILTRVP